MNVRKLYCIRQLPELLKKIHSFYSNERKKYIVNFYLEIETKNGKFHGYENRIIDPRTSSNQINSWSELKRTNRENKIYTIPLIWDKKHLTLFILFRNEVYHINSGQYSVRWNLMDDIILYLAHELKAVFNNHSRYRIRRVQGNANLCYVYILEFYDRMLKMKSSKAKRLELPSLKRLGVSELNAFMDKLGSGKAPEYVKHHVS